MTELRGPRVLLRPAREPDLPAILAVLREPSVARWWGETDESEMRAELLDESEVICLAIEIEGRVSGLIQYHEESDPMYRHAGIDLVLSEPYQGRGIGPEALSLVARHLLTERGHHRLTIDPAAANRNAVRAYEKLGFKPVGVMRRYERGPDGTWHDGLLMDLLVEEFTPQDGLARPPFEA
ncbi:MAG: GNAT family N-acetyltransferase [Actinomycetota bacterium]